MPAITTIRSHATNLTKRERLVVDFLLDNVEDVPFLSIHEISKTTGVSVSTISRLAPKLGYTDLKALKIDLAQESSTTSISAIFQAVNPGDTEEDIAGKVFGGYIKSFQDTLALLDISTLTDVARRIALGRRVVFFGIGSSGNVARDAAISFAHLDLQADAYTDAYEMFIQAKNMKKGHVAIGISHSGRSRLTVEALRMARANKAWTVSLSNYRNSPLATTSDVFFLTAFTEKKSSTAGITSRPVQQCIIDVLYLLTAQKKKSLGKNKHLQMIAEEILKTDK